MSEQSPQNFSPLHELIGVGILFQANTHRCIIIIWTCIGTKVWTEWNSKKKSPIDGNRLQTRDGYPCRKKSITGAVWVINKKFNSSVFPGKTLCNQFNIFQISYSDCLFHGLGILKKHVFFTKNVCIWNILDYFGKYWIHENNF